MKIELNINKKIGLGILFTLIVLGGIIFVRAFNPLNNPPANPAVFGHSANEINWSGLSGTVNSCPNGFSLVGSGQNNFCISTAQSAASFQVAIDGCHNKNPSAVLCSPQQHLLACFDASSNIANDVRVWTLDVGAGGYAGVFNVDGGTCTKLSYDDTGRSNPYHCCIQTGGVNINVGGGGAGWKSVDINDNTKKFVLLCDYKWTTGSVMYFPSWRSETTLTVPVSGSLQYNSKKSGDTGSTTAIYESCPAGITGIGQ